MVTTRVPSGAALRDVIARFGWTILEVGVGVASAPQATDWLNSWLGARLPQWSVTVIIGGVAALLKSLAATLVGNPDDATFTKPVVDTTATEAPPTPLFGVTATSADPAAGFVPGGPVGPVGGSPWATVTPPSYTTPEPVTGSEPDSGDAVVVEPPDWSKA